MRDWRAAAAAAATLCLVATPGRTQELSGVNVWAANCSGCHRLRAVATYTAAQWNSIATHMALQARLTPAQTRAVREFLVSSARGQEASAMPARQATPVLVGVGSRASHGGAASALAPHGQVPSPPDGREIYSARCVACHGPEGHGNGPAAAALNPRPVNFTDPSQRKAVTDSAMVEVISHGRGAMPAFGQILSRAEIDSVVEYVKSFSH